ncbi:MAG TPA: glycosyltransferase [Ktedonobacteraceae bacterium]|nr:glycosyltransferase [Ktedonobacteraceae bacterium]
MRILFVTPYPPSRIRVRGYGFLAQLRRSHEVTIAAQCASEQEQADVEKLRREGYEVVVVSESKKRSAVQSGLALLGTTPLQAAYARSARFARVVRQLFEQRGFDAIHVEHLRGIASMETLIGKYPLVWDAVDCISLLSKQTMAEGPSRAVRMVARLEYERTRRYEAHTLSLLSSTIVTSERDRQAMIELRRLFTRDLVSSDNTLGNDIQVIPNGVDLEYFRPMPQERRRLNLVFSGKMSYHANIATALYLYRQIMPLIWEQRPEATLTIVGSKPPKVVQALAQDPRVEVTGYVDDLRPYVTRAEVMPCPMVYSVGIQNKALEAMALGTPVVVARQAAESLGAQPGRDLLVADSAREFAQATLRLLDDADMRASLSQHGRAYVEQHHDWSKIAERLANVYQQARETHAPDYTGTGSIIARKSGKDEEQRRGSQ